MMFHMLILYFLLIEIHILNVHLFFVVIFHMINIHLSVLIKNKNIAMPYFYIVFFNVGSPSHERILFPLSLLFVPLTPIYPEAFSKTYFLNSESISCLYIDTHFNIFQIFSILLYPLGILSISSILLLTIRFASFFIIRNYSFIISSLMLYSNPIDDIVFATNPSSA